MTVATVVGVSLNVDEQRGGCDSVSMPMHFHKMLHNLVFINLQHFVYVNDPYAWRVFNCICQCMGLTTSHPLPRPSLFVPLDPFTNKTIELHHKIVQFTRKCRCSAAATHIFGVNATVARGGAERERIFGSEWWRCPLLIRLMLMMQIAQPISEFFCPINTVHIPLRETAITFIIFVVYSFQIEKQ